MEYKIKFKRWLNKVQSVKAKVAIAFVLSFIVVFGVFIAYTNITLRYQSNIAAKDKVNSIATEYTRGFAKEMNVALSKARSVAAIFESSKMDDSQLTFDRDEAIELMKSVIKESNTIYAICTVWDNNTFDNLDSLYANKLPYNESGRFAPYLYKDIYGGIAIEPLQNYEEEDQLWYWNVKRYKQEYITSPDIYTVNNKRMMLATFSVPVLRNNEFIGLVAVDILLDDLQDLIKNAKIFAGKATIRAYSFDGVVVADSKNEELAGKNISDFMKKPAHKLKEIRSGKQNTVQKGNTIVAKIPFFIGDTKLYWQMEVIVPLQNVSLVRQHLSHINDLKILLGLLLLIVLVIFIIIYINRLIKPLGQIAYTIEEISKGNIQIESIDSTGKEVKQINQSLELYIQSLNNQVEVLKNIAKGNFDKKVEVRSKHDIYAKSINRLIEGLIEAREKQEKNEIEARIRRWTNEGIAKFADILSEYSNDMIDFSRKIIHNLIDYLKVNQGAMYLINDKDKDDIYIELVAAYAYHRNRKAGQRIELEEGLVGRCIDDKQTICLREIPENYIRIGSGLGDKKPDFLLIVPLFTSEAVLGAIEIATFGDLPEYKRLFMQKVCENISITLQNIKINLQTRKLLKDSQHKAEMLAQQEEEMRQNYEELQTAQDISEMREAESRSLLNAINSNSLVAEMTIRGEFTSMNKKFKDLLKIEQDDLKGLRHSDFDALSKHEPEKYKKIWKKLLSGKVVTKNTHYQKKNLWLFETLTPILDKDDRITKIFIIATDNTETNEAHERLKLQAEEMREQEQEINRNVEEMHKMLNELSAKENELNGKIDAINKTLPAAEYELNGDLISCNDLFCKLIQQKQEDLKGSNHKEIAIDAQKYHEKYKALWHKLRKGKYVSTTITYKVASGGENEVDSTFYPLPDKEGKVYRVLELCKQ